MTVTPNPLHLSLARRGWLHDLDLPIDVSRLDWVNAFRVMHGQYVTHHDIAARKVAVDVLTSRGHSADWIAEATGMKERSVVRLRQRPVSGRPDRSLAVVLGWTAVRGRAVVADSAGAA